MKDGFSVVIPLYNKAAYVERAIYSVLSQNISCYEIIVVDDGSTDGGAIKARAISDKIRIVVQTNQGVSVARNRGIAEAKYSIISFLDADDSWTPDYLRIITRLIADYPEAGAYASAYDVVTSSGYRREAVYKGIFPKPWEGLIPNYFKCLVLGEPPISSSSVSIPKKIFKEIGYFAVNEHFGEDQDMWGRIALKYPIAFSNEIGATYQQNAKNRNSVQPIISGEYCFIKTGEKAIKEKILPVEDSYYLEEYLAYCRILRAAKYILSGNKVVASFILNNTRTSLFLRKKFFWKLCLHLKPEILKRGILLKENLNRFIPLH